MSDTGIELIYPRLRVKTGEPLAKTKVASKSELAPGKMIGVNVSGKWLLIANVQGNYFAMNGKCNHAGGELWKGTLTELCRQMPQAWLRV